MGQSHTSKAMAMAILFMMVAMASSMANAQTICNIPVSGLISCRPAVTPPNPTPPGRECCTALSHADLQCLCRYKNSSVLPSLGIDPNLAMQLPSKCKIPGPKNC